MESTHSLLPDCIIILSLHTTKIFWTSIDLGLQNIILAKQAYSGVKEDLGMLDTARVWASGADWPGWQAYALVSTAIFIIGLHLVDGLATTPEGKPRRRRKMSFNSECMLATFPAEAKVVPPIINILLLFEDSCPAAETLAALIKAKLLPYDRWRCGVAKSASGAYDFVDLPAEHLEVPNLVAKHIFTCSVASEAAMTQKVEELCATDIEGYEGDRPMWCIHRIEGKPGRLSGVLFRIHHVLGDGIALINSMSALFENKDGTPLDLKIAEQMSGGKVKGAAKEKSSIGGMAAKLGDLVTSLFSVLYIALSPYDADTAFSPAGKPTLAMTSRPRKIVLIPTMRLSFIKKIKDAAKVTINDILMAAMTGTIRKFCQLGKDDGTKPLQMRALVPVAFPRPVTDLTDSARAMRNKWAFASIPMPLSKSSARERLNACVEASLTIKKSAIVGVQLLVQSYLLPLLPPFLQKKTAHDVFSRHTFVFSNLPGPATPCYLCQQRLVGLQAIFPNMIPQVILISYGGEVFFNMTVDPGVVTDTELFKKMYVDEMKGLAEEFGVKAEDADILSPLSPEKVFGVIA